MSTFNRQMQRYALAVIAGTLIVMLMGMVVGWLAFSRMSEGSMTALADAVADAAKQHMVAALDATVATEVTRVLQTGTEHRAEVVKLLRQEASTPGLIDYALRLTSRDLMLVEQKQPGITEYAASPDGQFAYAMYKRNERRRCNSTRSEQNRQGGLVNACININP